ncbi:unnamed protein product [Phytophthora fragariaefolia]|uniref:Unnamed protein product n=1 Tax=Phytophthora fragariaefolia TaxID=1490495 RepID=A0A9W7D5P3_9STRA|nr:unnamed protein product [Phytophthora fragariaefolia]
MVDQRDKDLKRMSDVLAERDVASAPVSLPLSSAAPTSNTSAAGLAMTPADFQVPSAEPRRVPGSPFRRDHLTPETRPSVHVPASSPAPCSGSAASAAPGTSSAGLVSSTVVTSAPESTAQPIPAASAGLVSPTPSSTRRTSPQATKPSAGSTSKSARKSPVKATAGSSRRAPPLEASDAEVLGWSSGATNSAARATSASSPLVVDSPSSPAVTPTPAPAEASSSKRQSSSDDSADDEVVLQRSRRLRRRSIVESDESSDSVAEALEGKPTSPLTPASVPPTPSTGQKRPSSPVTPASTKKARANTSAKSSSSPRPVAKSTSRVRPTAKSSKAAKAATMTARGTVKSGKSAKSADPPAPASGQSVSASGTAAVSTPTSSASSGQAPNSAGGATSLPDVLRLPILTLRTRAAQAVSRDSRVSTQMKIWRDPPFFHLGSARCWDQVMGSCVVEIQKEIVNGKPPVRSTPSSLSGLAAFADVRLRSLRSWRSVGSSALEIAKRWPRCSSPSTSACTGS